MECNKVLKIFLNKNADHLSEQYSIRLQEHNDKISQNYPDSGFDLLTPQEITSLSFKKNSVGLEQFKLDTGVSAAMFWLNSQNSNLSLPYYLYPRSSISKTELRMANSVGIIDAGYRGPLIGVFDIPYDMVYTLNKIVLDKQSRVLQICSNDLSPFRVELVESIEDLQLTWRGDGGFGSTGK
jgi:dUTP pyrophosphatase